MKQVLGRTLFTMVVVGATALACGGDRDGAFDTTVAGGEVAPGTDTSAAATSPAMDLPTTDAGVIEFVTAVDNAEVEAGELARTKATNAEVKNFAQMMVNEHRKHRDQMQRMKSSTDSAITSPSGAQTSLQSMHSQTMSQLQSLSGAEFDRAYIDNQVSGHQSVLDMLQQLQNRTQNTQLQQHLTQVTSTVQKHLDQARAIQGKLGATTTPDTTQAR